MVPIELKPTSNARVIDLVAAAGIDTTDWANFKGGSKNAGANPRYCYEWAFVQPGKVAVLNLWYEEMEFENGIVFERRSLREIAPTITGVAAQTRLRRLQHMERVIADVSHQNLSLRVIVCSGARRNLSKPNSVPSRVTHRMLDPEPWFVAHYDAETGEYVAQRGLRSHHAINAHKIQPTLEAQVRQSLADSAEKRRARLATATRNPTKIGTFGFVFQRNPDVIAEVLLRAKGTCERCGSAAPFIRKSDHTPYLEVHHLRQLALGGEDTVENAVGVCPNCHRKEHYG